MRRLRDGYRLEWLIALLIIGAIASLLLDRMAYYQEEAEKAELEYTITVLKSGLRYRMASMLMEGRAQDFAALAAENPLDWLEQKPSGYADPAAGGQPKRFRSGTWHFDAPSHTLIYTVANGSGFQPDSSGQKRVRLQVKLIRGSIAGRQGDSDSAVVSAALVLLEPYRWL